MLTFGWLKSTLKPNFWTRPSEVPPCFAKKWKALLLYQEEAIFDSKSHFCKRMNVRKEFLLLIVNIIFEFKSYANKGK